jgi:hypothetical protein
MTDRKDALTELLAKVEAGDSYDSDQLTNYDSIGEGFGFQEHYKHAWVIDAWRGSLDAAKALHDAVLPEWDFSLGPNCAEVADYPNRCGVYFIGTSSNPARAWLIAILKALIAGENTNRN